MQPGEAFLKSAIEESAYNFWKEDLIQTLCQTMSRKKAEKHFRKNSTYENSKIEKFVNGLAKQAAKDIIDNIESLKAVLKNPVRIRIRGIENEMDN